MPLNSKKKAATAKASTKVASRSAHARPRPESPDAIELLKTDHREVEEFFAQFEKASSRQRKAAIVANICQALSVHAAIEEEIFYPAVRKALSRATRKLVDEAEVEHEGIKTLVAYLKKAKPTVRHYDAKVVVLKEYVSHHVKEEEHVLFPEVRISKLDTAALGRKLANKKEKLTGKRVPPPRPSLIEQGIQAVFGQS